MHTEKDLRPCKDRRKKCAMKNAEGKCEALNTTDFGGKPCPFYKTKEQVAAQNAKNAERLGKMRKWTYYHGIYGKTVSK